MTFVLVDYKGGSAFKDCVELPHTVGMVTDLDAHLVERALASLARRAAAARAPAGRAPAPRTSRTTRRCAAGTPALAPLPRLLHRHRRVRLAGAGAARLRHRPGQHRPAGPVARHPPAARHPAAQRRGLARDPGQHQPADRAAGHRRGREPATSSTPRTPARIAQEHPGPGLRAARATPRWCRSRPAGSAAAGPGRRPDEAAPPWAVTAGLGRPRPAALAAAAGRGSASEDEITDLEVLVGRGARGQRRSLGVPAQHSPWLPALPPRPLAARTRLQVPGCAGGRPAAGRPAPYGVEDLPGRAGPPAGRRRPRLVRAPDRSAGRRAAAAPSCCARSPARWPRTHSCADVHLYGIDCGNGALLRADPAAALRRGGQPHRDRAGGPADRAGSTGEIAPPAGAAGRQGLRRHRRAAGRGAGGRPAAAHRACCSTAGRASAAALGELRRAVR